jgi:signal peptidase I
MDTSRELGPSPLQEDPTSLLSDVVDLRNDLDIELWFRGKLDRPQSVLIRSTTPDGVTKSSFMHINGKVEQIPVFDSQDPLVLQKQRAPKVQKVARSINKPERTDSEKSNSGRFIVKAIATLVALVFLASLITGFGQMRVVLTGSMKPAINPGDLVIAASTSLVEPVVGKVVLYSVRDLQGNVVTVWCHRIIAGNSTEGFTIKGDANDQADLGLINVSDIQSVVVLRIPFVGHLFNIYSLILIFGGLILLSLATSRRKSK